MNKKKLYESIMLNISRQVRRALNESIQDKIEISINKEYVEFRFIKDKITYCISRHNVKNGMFTEYLRNDRTGRIDKISTTVFYQFSKEAADNVLSLLKIIFNGYNIDSADYYCNASNDGSNYCSDEIIWPNMEMFGTVYDPEVENLIDKYQIKVYNRYMK